MGLSRYRLGELIERRTARNTDLVYGVENVRGINTEKRLITTRADLQDRDLSTFRIVKPNEFLFSRRLHQSDLSRLNVTYNNTNEDIICTDDNVVFCIKNQDILLPDYLFMYFNRSEFDRYASFHSWGSSVRFFNWEEMCDVVIDLPPVEIQRKYVAVYLAVKEQQRVCERGLEDLKLVCDMYIEDLRRKMPCVRIGDYIRAVNQKNDDNSVTLFQGVTVDHVFTEPKRIAEDAENGSIVRTGQFAFNKVMKAHNTKLPIALRYGPDCVVSNSYQVFEVVDKDKLLPEYLMLWFNRSETQRYAGFMSFGTTRDIFSFEDLCNVSIPIPDISIQRSIADIYTVYQKRKATSERLKSITKTLCPVLIKGAIEDAQKTQSQKENH